MQKLKENVPTQNYLLLSYFWLQSVLIVTKNATFSVKEHYVPFFSFGLNI